MNDLKHLLDSAVPAVHDPVDPTPDLARGRALLHSARRRRTGTVLGVAAAAAGLTAVASLLPPAPAHDGPSGVAASRVTSPADTPAAPEPGVQLVAWTGAQPPGYRVAEVPDGWEVQGGNDYALTLARIGDPDQNPDSFAGKLVVMLESSDAEGGVDAKDLAEGGRYRRDGDTWIFALRLADGRVAIVQAPDSLGWDQQRMTRFAQGIEVLSNAKPGQG